MRIIGGLQPFIRIVSPFVPARSQSKVLGDIQTDQHRLYKYLDILMLHTKIWRFSMGFSWFPGLSFSGWTVAILCNCNNHSKSPTWNDLWFWGMVVPDVKNNDQGECSHWCFASTVKYMPTAGKPYVRFASFFAYCYLSWGWGGVGWGGMLTFLVLRALYIAILRDMLVRCWDLWDLLLRYRLLRCWDPWDFRTTWHVGTLLRSLGSFTTLHDV